jgi:carboxypeptidase C (cathepsin A)
MKWLILLATVVLFSQAVDEGDWVDPFLLPIPFQVRPFFAGYLRAAAVKSLKSLYYVYTPSQGNPSKDPLMVVISPFPGCSSLHNWLYSSGEFTFVRNQDSFKHNANNWNKQANVLYIEGPAGTGFSFGASQNITDESTQNEYFRAILAFY